jgi:ribosomal protein L32
MAVPKGKTSKARRDTRRSNVWKIKAPQISKCTCGEYVLSHRVCKACGQYKGREIFQVEA